MGWQKELLRRDVREGKAAEYIEETDYVIGRDGGDWVLLRILVGPYGEDILARAYTLDVLLEQLAELNDERS